MSLIEFTRDTLEDYRTRLYRALDGLTDDELNWRPNRESNSIAFIMWHTTRVEDRWFQVFAQGKPDVWSRDVWHDKLGLREDERGFGYGVDELAAFPKLAGDDLRGCFEAVRAETAAYLDSLDESDLDIAPGRSPFGAPGSSNRFAEFTIRRMFRQVIGELMQHLGHMAFLRGLQRGLDG
jgi:uncharacterized damage-inducible protein DinB